MPHWRLDRLAGSLLADGPGAQGDWWQSLLGSPLPAFILMGVFFYLLLIRPERKNAQQLEQLRAGLKKNDQVITSGGICGTVVNASAGSPYITIRVDEGNNTRLRVLRTAIARVGPLDNGADKEESA